MERFLILLSMLGASISLAQQSSISGVVSIHNSQFETGKRQYVTNAQVEDDFEKATAQVTDANGIFKLIFVGVPEKTTVNLIVKKDSLAVVNIDALGTVTGQRDQVRLSMAAPNKIAEYRRQIYNIGKTEAEKNLAALLQKKGKAIEELQKDTSANAAKIKTLQTEYAALSEQSKKIEEQAQELARKYAPINLDDASPLCQESFRYFQKGELDQALKILQQANLAQQAEKILQERQSIATIRKETDQRDSIQQQRTEDVLEALQFKADLHNSRFEFDSTSVCYDIMLQLDSINVKNLWNYANFLAFQREYQKAMMLYEKGLSVAKTDELKAQFLNNLAVIYGYNQKMSQAESAFQEDLKIYRQLATKNPDVFLPNVAVTLNNLGIYYRANQKMSQAESAFREALQIYRQLATLNQDAFLPDVALTLNNLGAYYHHNQKMLQAESAYQEALQIRRHLVALNREAFLPAVAMTLNNLGVYYRDNQKMPQADSAFHESLEIKRLLAAQNPDAFLPNVAVTLNNLGNYYRVNQKMLQAESAYQEALQIYQQLAAKNPDTFLPDLAGTLNNLGIYYRANKQMLQAGSAFQEALQIQRQLAALNPDAFLPDIAMTLNNLGGYYLDHQKMAQAESAYQEALQIRKQLAVKNPDTFLPDVAMTLNNLGGYYRSNQKMPQADSSYQEALRIYQKLDVKNNKSLFHDMNMTLNNLGNFSWWALLTKDFALSEKAALRFLELDNTKEYVLTNLGHSYLLRGQYQQAQITYERLKGKNNTAGKDFKIVLFEDYKELEEAGITHPYMAKMKAWIAGW